MGEKVLQNYKEFVQSLPEVERDLPYLKAPQPCDENFLSPNQVLQHLEQGTLCGEKLQEMQEELRE